jgi:hypothetical protein
MLIRGQSRNTTRTRLAWNLWTESISKEKTGYEEPKQRNYTLNGKVEDFNMATRGRKQKECFLR